MADPGFPVGGRRPRRRSIDSRGGYISKILYVETKESGPLGGVRRARPRLDPPMMTIAACGDRSSIFVRQNRVF